jgi:hypothetical protein
VPDEHVVVPGRGDGGEGLADVAVLGDPPPRSSAMNATPAVSTVPMVGIGRPAGTASRWLP